MTIIKTIFIVSLVLLLGVVAFFAFGGPMWQSYVMGNHDREISKYSRSVEAATDDASRAQALANRAGVYAEKARYGRVTKLLPRQEYARVFELAIADYGAALKLDARQAKFFFARGMAYYNRAIAIDLRDGEKETYFPLALANFNRAAHLDSSDVLAWDLQGLVYIGTEQYGEAIASFTEVLRLDQKRGALRLAETYCEKAYSRVKASDIEAAIPDYEKSIEFRTSPSGCECEAFNALAGIYAERKAYDRAREVIAKAHHAHQAIDVGIVKAVSEGAVHE